MSKIEQFNSEGENEQKLYVEREEFIKKNYPADKSHYDVDELLNSGLDGMEVIEKRGKDGKIEGLISYVFNQDRNEIMYLSIGIMLTGKEFEEEGIMSELFSEVKKIAESNGCEYIVAIADTEEDEKFLLNNNFSEEEDNVTGRKHFRMDLF